jgi:hypothetical protein
MIRDVVSVDRASPRAMVAARDALRAVILLLCSAAPWAAVRDDLGRCSESHLEATSASRHACRVAPTSGRQTIANGALVLWHTAISEASTVLAAARDADGCIGSYSGRQITLDGQQAYVSVSRGALRFWHSDTCGEANASLTCGGVHYEYVASCGRGAGAAAAETVLYLGDPQIGFSGNETEDATRFGLVAASTTSSAAAVIIAGDL